MINIDIAFITICAMVIIVNIMAMFFRLPPSYLTKKRVEMFRRDLEDIVKHG